MAKSKEQPTPRRKTKQCKNKMPHEGNHNWDGLFGGKYRCVSGVQKQPCGNMGKHKQHKHWTKTPQVVSRTRAEALNHLVRPSRRFPGLPFT
jgi:hypothetical protein